MGYIDNAKAEVSDEGVFTPDQIERLHEMLDQLRTPVDGDAKYPNSSGSWPWQIHHPWRHAVGFFFWDLGHRVMHGRSVKRR